MLAARRLAGFVKILGRRLRLISQRLLVVRVASPTLTNHLHIGVILIKIGITLKGNHTLPLLLVWQRSSWGMVFLVLSVVGGVLRRKVKNALVVNLTTCGMQNLYSVSQLTHQQGANIEG